MIDPGAFAALMAPLGPWGTERRVAVAVSGGADSLCLAWLASSWGRPFGLIVDHGLRPESAAEASLTAERLARFGVPSRILTLQGLLPGPGIAARARAARYAALAEAAGQEGLSDLLLGHHAGDQAETALIRRSGGSQAAGLAGMAALSETPSLRLVRPLLGAAPGRLRATLRAQGIPWVEDPSNRDIRALRTQMRRRLDDPAGEGAETARLLAESRGHAARRAEDEARIAVILARRASLFPEGYAVLTPGPIDALSLAALIRALTGAPYAPRTRALARLAAALGTAAGAAATLGGLRFMPAGRLGPGTLLVREAASLPPPVPAAHGVIWDRRFRLTADGALPAGATLGAVGDESLQLRRCSDLPDAVLRTLPALRDPQGGMIATPFGVLNGWTKLLVRLTLTPFTPVAGACFHV